MVAARLAQETGRVDLLGPAREEIKLLFHDPVKYFSLARDASALRISGRNMNHKALHLISPYVFAAKSARGLENTRHVYVIQLCTF